MQIEEIRVEAFLHVAVRISQIRECAKLRILDDPWALREPW